MGRTRRRAERTQAPAEHQRGKYIAGKTGGSYDWLVSQLRDNGIRIVIDLLHNLVTIMVTIMASGLLLMCCMCCANPSTAAARYGLPPSEHGTAIALATTQRNGAGSAIVLVIGCVLEYREKNGKEDNWLRIVLVILLLVWNKSWPRAKMTMLDGEREFGAHFMFWPEWSAFTVTVLLAVLSLVWCVQTAHEERSVVPASDFELAKMELQRLTSEDVLSRKQRSRIARTEYEAKKATRVRKEAREDEAREWDACTSHRAEKCGRPSSSS